MSNIRMFAIAAAVVALAAPVQAQTTINLTVMDGYPPKSLWIKEFVDFYIPEVDKRLAKGNKYKIAGTRPGAARSSSPTACSKACRRAWATWPSSPPPSTATR
jgi:hypothetical protein